MAYKESDSITSGASYTLGEYTFSIQNVVSEDERIIQAHVAGPDGNAAKGISVPSSSVLESWSVEANESVATVYAVVKVPKSEAGEVSSDIISGVYPYGTVSLSFLPTSITSSTARVCTDSGALVVKGNNSIYSIIASMSESIEINYRNETWTWDGKRRTSEGSYQRSGTPVTINGKTAYYFVFQNNGVTGAINVSGGVDRTPGDTDEKIAWSTIYGTIDREYEAKEMLVARFAIDIHEAGGDAGGDDSWDDPEDYDPEEDPIEYGDPDYPDPDDPDYPDPIEYGDPDYPDPDDPDYPDPLYPGDPDYPYDPDDPEYPDPYHPDYHPDYYPPAKTLYLTVTGALSGRHNDPLNDTSYSHLPSDKATIKNHGYGGDGGNGGGGGAGASTVVVHRFATSKANSKEIIAIARRHGYGSGGGKGGKGGSGCIIIYY